MCNYYIDSKIISSKSYYIVIDNFIENNNFNINAEKIVTSSHFNDKIFEYVITLKAISSVTPNTWIKIFQQHLFSDEMIVLFLNETINQKNRESYWSNIITYQPKRIL